MENTLGYSDFHTLESVPCVGERTESLKLSRRFCEDSIPSGGFLNAAALSSSNIDTQVLPQRRFDPGGSCMYRSRVD